VGAEGCLKKKKEKKTTMTDMVAHVQSKGVMNPRLNLSSVPPTDLSMASCRYLEIAPFNTGINPVDFQIDPQEDFIDLNNSFIKLEIVLKKDNNTNLVIAV